MHHAYPWTLQIFSPLLQFQVLFFTEPVTIPPGSGPALANAQGIEAFEDLKRDD